MTAERWDDPAVSGPIAFEPAPCASEPGAAIGGETFAGPELGRGGHAIVVRGEDRHLPREVAWKVAVGAVGRATLAHEARVLASLEHPAIVPIYDLADDGVALRMALRIVRGRTLEALLDGPRLDLIRHVLAATEAVAWAHGRGVVHRDLKPANIMVGELGQTQVIDWGLALRLDEVAANGLGAVVGTPQTMSPEQARGEAVDPRSDVWSLGATLAHVLAGRPLLGDEPAAVLIARVARGERPAVAALAPDAPRELVAIAERALAPLPEHRFPDAAAMAEDLLAWLEGRRVSAHDYGALELAGRFVRRFRLPIAIGLLALATVATVLVGDYLAVRDERDRAREAEARALDAVAERVRVVAASDLAEARRELAARARPEALAAARRALAASPGPDARGVLAAASRGLDATRVATWSAGACVDLAFAPDGRRVLCGTRDALALWEDGALRWRRAVASRAVTLVGGGASVVYQGLGFGLARLDAATGEPGPPIERTCSGRFAQGAGAGLALDVRRDCLAVIGPRDVALVRPCGAGSVAAAAAARDGRWAALCRSGALAFGRGEDVARTVATPLASADGHWLSLGFAADDAVVAGSTTGELAWLGPDGAVGAQVVLEPPTVIRAIERAPDAEWLLVTRDGAPPALVDARSLAGLGQLPRDEVAVGVPVVGGLIGAAGGPISRWSVASSAVGAGAGPALLDGLGGVTGLAVADDLLVVTHDRVAELRALRDGRALATASFEGITKAAAFDLEGHVDVGVAAVAFAPDAGAPLRGLPDVRRLARLDDGRLVRATTSRHVEVVGDEAFLDGPWVVDLAVRGQVVAALVDAELRGLRVFSLAPDPVEVAACPVASGAAVALGPGFPWPRAFVAEAEGVIAYDVDRCAVEAIYPTDRADLSRLAVSSSGAWIAAGRRLGEGSGWAGDGELRARVDAHSQVVTALAMSPDERWLATGAWDGRVRLIALGGVLDQRP